MNAVPHTVLRWGKNSPDFLLLTRTVEVRVDIADSTMHGPHRAECMHECIRLCNKNLALLLSITCVGRYSTTLFFSTLATKATGSVVFIRGVCTLCAIAGHTHTCTSIH